MLRLSPSRHPLGTLIAYSGREYDLTKTLHVRDLAATLGVLREALAVQDEEDGIEAVAHVLWKAIRKQPPGSLTASEWAGGAR